MILAALRENIKFINSSGKLNVIFIICVLSILCCSPKEHNEFAIVRECIRRKLEASYNTIFLYGFKNYKLHLTLQL